MPKRFYWVYQSFGPHPSPLNHALRDYRQLPGSWTVLSMLLPLIWLVLTKPNKLMWPRKDWDNTFPCKLSRGGLVVLQRRQQKRFKIFKRHHLLYLCCSFLYFCATNLIFDRHVISILAPRYVLHEHVFCSQCFVIKFYPILKNISRKVVINQITY